MGNILQRSVKAVGGLPKWTRRLGYYGLALLFVAAAAGLRWALPEVLGPTPFLAFYLAWVGAAAFGGLGPGLLATLASWLCIDLLDPASHVTDFADPTAVGRFAVLLAGGLAVSLIAAAMRRGRIRERESETQLRTVVENLTEGVIASDLNGRLFQWNRTALEMHGFASLDEARRRLPEFADIFELSTLDGPPLPLEQWPLARVLRGEALRDWEVRVRRIQGDWERIFSYGGSLVREERGQPRLAVITVTDITDRKRAEEALRQSESFYRQTLESIPGMVFTTRPDGYCDYQSQQWVDYTGVPISEHLGDGWNKLLHPEDRPRAFAAWRAAVEGRAPYDLEYRVRRHDGVYEWFKVVGRPIRDTRGQIVRWFGTVLNIEALKSIEHFWLAVVTLPGEA
jgi:PAS domain S-box-containing protein